MHRITYRVKVSTQSASRRLKKFVGKTRSDMNTTSKPAVFNRFSTTKKIVQLSSIALLSLPAKSLTTTGNGVHAFDRVMVNKSLTIASVPGDSTFFATDNFQHGFGYDLARSYANELEVSINLKTYTTDAQALAAVKRGEADLALTTSSTQEINKFALASMNLSCGQDAKLTANGLHPKVSWTFADADDPLSQKASHFLCDNVKVENTQKLAAFYNQNLLKDAYNQQHFNKALSDRLPDYQSLFKEQASEYNHDWQLLVAMGYQESHLNANAISPTGVKGLMMLTNSTAKAMGVSDRVDPTQSISGGARYLEEMKAQFADVPQTDRLWFALAAYNMGPNAVKSIQRKLEAAGQDKNSWANVYAYLSDHAKSNGRYVQCMHYVSNIRSYLESIKTQTV
ncbi:transglycosylase SLT domain-containing protein [Psychrobacter pygoscelis]|uniref:transglycosylase SLT domain-containing protein n=1 Tax=Psychrobacter pygoscelis TaxID=2488563 RepID=UPI00103E498F|nr:transglycosylase SLT domain-containing protein [Psychrobacter pygoscelis]